MFENLKNRIKAEAAEAKKNARFFIEKGYYPTWAEENRKPGDNGIKHYCTAARWDAYQAGKISREKIVELTIKRMEKQEDKHAAAKLEKLEKAAAAPDLDYVSISVLWKRNPTWGYCPTATISVYAGGYYEEYSGHASGCGYDKRTAAVGGALNQSTSIMKMLYTAKENGLKNPPEKGRYCGAQCWEENTSNNTLIHYGAGYGVLPYFEGGVGMTSFYGVFEKCGYKCTASHETKTTDYYLFSKVEG